MIALTAPCYAQSQIIEDAHGQVADIRAWAVAVHDKPREVPQECGQRVAPVHHAVAAVVQDVTIQVVLFCLVRGAGLRSRGDRHHGIEGDMFGRCHEDEGVLTPACDSEASKMLYTLHFSFSWVPKTSFTPLAESKFLKTEAQAKSRTMEPMTQTSNNCKNKKKKQHSNQMSRVQTHTRHV